MYLYYVVDGCGALLSETGYLVVDYDGVALDTADPDQLSNFVSDILAARGVEEGVCLAKTALPDLAFVPALSSMRDIAYTAESAWGDLGGSSGRVDAEVVGLVRVWTVPDWRVGYGDVWSKYVATKLDLSTYGVFWADPAPVVNEGVLALFLAAIVPAGVLVEPATDDREGTVFPYLGAWSCVAVRMDSVINAFGLDFTVRVPWTYG